MVVTRGEHRGVWGLVPNPPRCSLLLSEAIQRALVSANQNAIWPDSGRAGDGRVEVDFLELFAGPQVEHIEEPVIRQAADINATAHDHGRGVHLSVGLEAPLLLASIRVEGVNLLVP